MNILGISAFYHDSASCLVVDGEIVAAAQEERFTRKKHDFGFPRQAINYCLESKGVNPDQLDYVVFYEKPFLKFDRLMETYFSFAPIGFRSFAMALPVWLKQKLYLRREIYNGIGGDFDGTILFPQHHQSHAASAFFPSPFKEAAILTVDGVGEWATTTVGVGEGNKIKLLKEIRFPHSLGLLYSAFTYYTGFRVNSGEYKLMGLAPYGNPKYAREIEDNLIEIFDDGSYWLNMDFFNYCQGLTMTSDKFHDLFGGPPRQPESSISQKEMDIAASIQVVTEKVMLNLAQHARELTGKRNLCLSGGVALNCVANGKILRHLTQFDNLFIQPASGDAGSALGAALFAWYQLLDNQRISDGINDTQKGSYLGPVFSEESIRNTLKKYKAKFHNIESEKDICNKIATLIDQGKVIGHFNGRMEFGPRALGARSIIGDARNQEMQKKMNLKIKFRESFRPFAPSVVAEDVSEYFELDSTSPYMLLVADVVKDKRVSLDEAENVREGLQRLGIVRSEIPAVTHVDCSARVQTVHQDTNPRYYGIIRAFKEKTGCPVIINTSFNVRGEPIVCTPEDAFRCFMFTEMDVLVLGNHILYKEEQPVLEGAESHLQEFELD